MENSNGDSFSNQPGSFGSGKFDFKRANQSVKNSKAYLVIGSAVIFALLVFVGIYFSWFNILHAEDIVKIIAVSPDDCNYTDEISQIQLNLNSGNKNIVAVQVVATYDPAKVEVTSIDTAGSAFSFAVQNTIDASNGKIMLAMAKASPGVNSTAALIGKVNIKAKANFTGSAIALKFASMNAIDDSAAIVDDGLGTNVLEVVENSFTSTVFCDVLPPTVSVTSPVANATVSGSVNFNATATDNVGVTKVEFMVDGTVKNTDTASPYSYVLDTKTLANGLRKLDARACDAKNNCATSTINVTVDNDTTPPTVSITAPANNATISGIVNFTATAADNKGVTAVDFLVDGVVKNTDTTTPYSYSLDTNTLANGARKLEAKACDAAANCATSVAVNVTVDNDKTAPTVSITSPANNATVTGTIDIIATAADNKGVAKVEFMVDGAVKNTDTSSPYSYSLDTVALANGSRKLEAKACDASNNCATSSAVNVTVNNDKTPPVISGISAKVTSSTSVSISWTTNENATSQVQYGLTTTYGSTTTKDTALVTNHAQTVSGLQAGQTYHYKVISTDGSGNTVTSTDLTFVVLVSSDINSDGSVDMTDLGILMSDYLKPKAEANNPKSDINGDGMITVVDLGILMSQWMI